MGQGDDDEFNGYFEDLDNDLMPNNNNGQRVDTNAGLIFNNEVDVNDNDFLDIYNMSPRERLMYSFRKNTQKLQFFFSIITVVAADFNSPFRNNGYDNGRFVASLP